MTMKEIVNMIDGLQEKGMTSDEIIEFIRFVESGEHKKKATEDSDDKSEK